MGKALNFYNNHNPARDIRVNLLEPERRGKIIQVDFSGESSRDKWASISAAISATLYTKPYDEVLAWTFRNIGQKTQQLAVIDIAKKFGWGKRRTYRALDKIDRELEKELRRRCLIPWSILRFYQPMEGKSRHIIARISEKAAESLDFRVEPSGNSSGIELVAYSDRTSKDCIITVDPREGAAIVSSHDIKRRMG